MEKMYLAHDIDGTCYLYYKEQPIFDKRFIVEDEDLVWISPIDPDDFHLEEGKYIEVVLNRKADYPSLSSIPQESF